MVEMKTWAVEAPKLGPNCPSAIAGDIFNEMLEDMLGKVNKNFSNNRGSYPYNEVSYLDENGKIKTCRLTFALAGFDKSEISVKVIADELLIQATKPEDKEDDKTVVYHHKGIAKRNFSTKYVLSSKVDKDSIKSSFINGILAIDIGMIPEKSQSINIATE